MSSLRHFDLLLGEALEQLVEACAEVRNINSIDNRYFLKNIGRITLDIWKLRDKIYESDSKLKRDFVVELEFDKNRYENLNELHHKAFLKEKQREIDSAKLLYSELLEKSRFGYFRLLGEAGLYRLTVLEKDNIENGHKARPDSQTK